MDRISLWNDKLERRKDRTLHAGFADGTKVTAFFGSATLVALIALASALPSGSWAAILWALGMLAAGAATGFLFGHPRAARSKEPPTTATTTATPVVSGAVSAGAREASPSHLEVVERTKPSTALEEIVDWLTKMVVGIGLVQLREVPSAIIRLGTLISRSLPMSPYAAQSVAVAIIVFFTSIGFLYGYLATRLYIQGAIDRADGALRQEVNRMLADVEETKQKQVSQDTALRKISRVAAASAQVPEHVAGSDHDIITDAASTAVELWDQDPNKGRFGGAAYSNHRKLEAELTPAFQGQPEIEACNAVVTVSSTDESSPLAGSVTFHLHPTYNKPTVSVPVVDGRATLRLQAWGAFTLGAEADGGQTKLELDLSTVKGAPPAFYDN